LGVDMDLLIFADFELAELGSFFRLGEAGFA
jgi:hypothetical protein